MLLGPQVFLNPLAQLVDLGRRLLAPCLTLLASGLHIVAVLGIEPSGGARAFGISTPTSSSGAAPCATGRPALSPRGWTRAAAPIRSGGLRPGSAGLLPGGGWSFRYFSCAHTLTV